MNTDITSQAFGPGDQDYWSFEGRAERNFAHGFLQYPAMMVPRMQGELIDLIRNDSPNMSNVWDPFVGAGTILAESMLRGLNFSGNDINPLAVLVSKTKCGPFYISASQQKSQKLYSELAKDFSRKIIVDFPYRDKWFTEEACIAFSRIRRGIMAESALWARRFFWVAMAECVRLSSNSRTSTYKLHLRPEKKSQKNCDDILQLFKKILDKNLRHFQEFQQKLSELGLISRGHYKPITSIKLADTTCLPPSFLPKPDVDLIITSPPYGDNRTTVPYGQYSYLPLNWIDLADIDANVQPSFLQTTNSIDSASLGGSAKFYRVKADDLSRKYSTVALLLEKMQTSPLDSQKKVISFFYDFDSCMDPIINRLKHGGYMVWTLGNRTVSNVQIPLDTIFEQMTTQRGLKVLKKIDRNIPSKRIPSKNNISATMRFETIIISKKI